MKQILFFLFIFWNASRGSAQECAPVVALGRYLGKGGTTKIFQRKDQPARSIRVGLTAYTPGQARDHFRSARLLYELFPTHSVVPFQLVETKFGPGVEVSTLPPDVQPIAHPATGIIDTTFVTESTLQELTEIYLILVRKKIYYEELDLSNVGVDYLGHIWLFDIESVYPIAPEDPQFQRECELGRGYAEPEDFLRYMQWLATDEITRLRHALDKKRTEWE